MIKVSQKIEMPFLSPVAKEWCQVVFSEAFKPEHSKRIHLFGKQDLAKLALAQTTCSEFNVIVTFEEVQ